MLLTGHCTTCCKPVIVAVYVYHRIPQGQVENVKHRDYGENGYRPHVSIINDVHVFDFAHNLVETRTSGTEQEDGDKQCFL